MCQSGPHLYFIARVYGNLGGALIVNIPPSVYCGVPPKYRAIGAAFGAAIAASFDPNAYVAVEENNSASCSDLSITVTLPAGNGSLFNGVLLQEDMLHGQRITQYAISVHMLSNLDTTLVLPPWYACYVILVRTFCPPWYTCYAMLVHVSCTLATRVKLSWYSRSARRGTHLCEY